MRDSLTKKMFDIGTEVYENVHLFIIFAWSNKKSFLWLNYFFVPDKNRIYKLSTAKTQNAEHLYDQILQSKGKKARNLLAID